MPELKEDRIKKDAPDFVYHDENTYSTAAGYVQKKDDKSELQLQEIIRIANILGFAILLSIFLGSLCNFLLPRLGALLSSKITILPNGQFVADQKHYYALRMLSGFVQTIVPFYIVSYLMDYRPKRDLPRGKIKARYLVPGIFIMLSLSIIGSTVASLIDRTAGSVGVRFVEQAEPAISSPVAFAFYLVSAAVLPAILEELMYRGAILQPLRQFGDRFAVVVSALVFTMAHQSFVRVPTAFICGLFLAYIAIATGSMSTCMILHLCNNVLSITFAVLSFRLSEQTFILLQTAVYAVILLLGVCAMVYWGKRDSDVFSIHDFEATNTLTKKLTSFLTSGGILIAAGVVVFLMFMGVRFTR